MRLKDKVAIVVGAGQSPGEGMGNGRATALTFAREGAKVLCVDHHLASAQETVAMITAKTARRPDELGEDAGGMVGSSVGGATWPLSPMPSPGPERPRPVPPAVSYTSVSRRPA